METRDLGFVHRYVPPRTEGQPVLLLLHGTGGEETSLLPLGNALARDAAFLSPRGKVMERGMPRFFRRIAEGVFDLEDLRFRTHELADFVEVAARAYGFEGSQVVAIGYSNGANIAASLMLLHPETLAAAILFHPMVPLVPDTLPNLAGVPTLITAGRRDPIVPARQTEDLASLLSRAGAEVETFWQENGHSLVPEEVEAAREWLFRWATHR